jgi:sugar O-acyltransferase (sialic acid O-acetyltransferase NeuD family)
MNNSIIIIGSGAQAELAYFYFKNDSPYTPVAFAVDKEYKADNYLFNLPILDLDQLFAQYSPKTCEVFISIGYSKLNNHRKNKYVLFKEKGYKLASYISSKATVLTKNIGDNCFILEDNTIQPYVTIGNNVTLWSGNHVGHHSIIENHNFISSHVVISGSCKIEELCFIGVNSTIADHVTIGKGCLIGAGSLILKDIPSDSLIVNKQSETSKIPAHKIRKF